MNKFSLDLTETNVKRMLKGLPVQFKKEQLHGSKHHLILHPLNHKQLTRARTLNKGARITLTPEEVEASGEGFGDWIKKIASGARWVKQNVIDSPLYQRLIKPIVREGVTALSVPVTAMAGPAAPIVQQGIEKLGQVTGAYGLPKKSVSKPRAKKASKPRAKKAVGGSFLLQ